MARILSVSYDEALLATRQLMLEADGHKVSSALGLTKAIRLCKVKQFDLVIIGHSIPEEDKQQIINTLREVCKTPVLALLAPAERRLRSANYNHELHGPEQFMQLIRTIVSAPGATTA